MTVNAIIAAVTDRIRQRSKPTRDAYLARIRAAGHIGPRRTEMPCSNLAHGMAACAALEKKEIVEGRRPCIAIVTAYNDMLSAHQPYETYPQQIKAAVQAAGGIARVAGGVPAMCDGVTQGLDGMELSLFSRDVIATSTAVALSHDLFDGALLLGICDKIVPGLVIGALTFGHLPAVFVPAGPMPTGIGNAEKNKVRQAYAQGKATRDDLLASESASYHSPGTCTFFGTANSNQMLMEIMGLHLPGASFEAPGTPIRDAFTREASHRVVANAAGPRILPVGEMIDERSFVNAIIGLLATGGSTNHTLHLLPMARAAGIHLDWQDFSDLSAVIPLVARVYPNGTADVNEFHRAGGMAYVIGELLSAGLLHRDVNTVFGADLSAYTQTAELVGETLVWRNLPAGPSGNPSVIATAAQPFAVDGGLKMLTGNLGRAVVKISAVKPEHRLIEAPCRIFTTQEDMEQAFKAGELHRDVVCVVRFQGPKANGMPELHKLTPALGVLQDLGFKVALVTDGRMSGASGKVPAAIHVTPEALSGGPIGRLQDGDVVRLDCVAGTLEVKVEASVLDQRAAAPHPTDHHWGTGRELFAPFRRQVSSADQGATIFSFDGEW
jgi:phosphogluconate dehydratase